MEIPKVFSLKNIWLMSVVFIVVLLVSLLPSYKANAADVTVDYYLFRIDTELNTPNTGGPLLTNGVTVTWKCNGTGYGVVQDGTSSDSSGGGSNADGIIKISSLSAENLSGEAGCDATEAITATASLNGWVKRLWSDTVSAGGSNITFTTRASMDYTIVVTGVKDELSNALTLDGASTNLHASASYSGTVASSSYSVGKEYIAGSDAGTVKAESSGFVSRNSSALSISSAASKSVGFGGASDDIDAAGLDYTIVVNSVADELGNALTLDGASTYLHAAASYNGTEATHHYSSNKLYIAGKTNGTITASSDGFVSRDSTTSTILETASQSIGFGSSGLSIDALGLLFGHKVGVYESGGTFADSKVTSGTVVAGNGYDVTCNAGTGGNAGYWYCAVPLAETATQAQFSGTGWQTTAGTYTVRTADATDQGTIYIIAYRPGGGGGGSYYSYVSTPTPSPSVTPTPTPALSPTPTPSVYVSPTPILQGGAVKLFRKVNDPKVYVQMGDGTLSWVKTLSDFNTAGYSWANVKVISGTEFAAMKVGGNVRIAKGIAYLRVRSGPSTANKIVGKVLPSQELKFTEIKNGWYKIDSGWISGVYAKEF